jgi:hypothetical protein
MYNDTSVENDGDLSSNSLSTKKKLQRKLKYSNRNRRYPKHSGVRTRPRSNDQVVKFNYAKLRASLSTRAALFLRSKNLKICLNTYTTTLLCKPIGLMLATHLRFLPISIKELSLRLTLSPSQSFRWTSFKSVRVTQSDEYESTRPVDGDEDIEWACGFKDRTVVLRQTSTFTVQYSLN